MIEPVQVCGARFFDKVNQDLGRAVQVTTRVRKCSTLTVVDVTGAEPELAHILTLLDRGRLRIHWEDAARTCYVFRWASGYSNASDVRIQGILEPRTGRELDRWTPKATQAPAKAPPDSGRVASWNQGRPKRPW
jgi:hypothetical protein